MKIIRCLSVLAVLAMTPMAFAGDCGTSEWCGQVFKVSAVALPAPADAFTANTAINYCLDRSNVSCPYTFVTSCNQIGGGACDKWNYGSAVTLCGNDVKTYYLSVNRTPDGWGQNGVPIATLTKYGTGCASYATVRVPPAPLTPTVTYPTLNQVVSSASWNIRFQSGIDAPRQNPGWPVTYKVRLKTWPTGTSEPNAWPAPFYTGGCVLTSDGSGDCKVAVSDLPSGNYRISVDALMDVSQSIAETSLWPVIFSSNATRTFSVASGRPPGCCR
jgi:hypothetical protein